MQFSSCKKDIPATEHFTSEFSPTTPFPENSNGILKFQSREHLKDYFSELNDYLFVEMIAFDTDSLLGLLETELNFTSIRPILDPVMLPESRIEGESFLKDEVRMSLLNPEYEIAISDSTFTYFSENTILSYQTGDIESESQIAP